MLLGNIDNVHFQSLIYNYEKNSPVDFTVDTRTYFFYFLVRKPG